MSTLIFKEKNIKTKIILIITFVVLSGTLFANPDIITASEALFDSGNFDGAMDLLEEGLSSALSNREKAEYYWRMAGTTLIISDHLKDLRTDKERMVLYKQGELYADLAIEMDPDNHNGYLMKSANIGRWGQTKGILASLFKAGDMRLLLIQAVNRKHNYSDAWGVLSMLYAAVPGRPLSFGNLNFAVSLSRMAYDSRVTEVRAGEEKDMGVVVRKDFALHLWDRDWSASRRDREQLTMKRKYESSGDFFEKHLYYEGIAAIPYMDDREEALIIMTELVDFLRSKNFKTPDDIENLEEVTGILEEWTI